MKKLITVFAVLIIFISCDKQASKELASEEMNAEELKSKYGIVLPDVSYGEDITAAAGSKGNKPKANAVVVVVWFNDLTLTESGGVLTTTISENAQWAGVQKFVDTTTVDGAVSVCNWYFAEPPGAITKTCGTIGTGFYRSWTSDFDYNIHVSSFLSVP